jgi:hypothetical protein
VIVEGSERGVFEHFVTIGLTLAPYLPATFFQVLSEKVARLSDIEQVLHEKKPFILR